MAEQKRHCPLLAADAIVIKKTADGNEILLITRGHQPNLGCLAFPGGHVDYGEDPIVGVIRELKEECSIEGKNPRLFDVRGAPGRDSRYHIVSILYWVDVEPNAVPKFGDDAASAKFYSLEKEIAPLSKDKFAFDHYEIIQDIIKFLKEKKQ